MMQFENPSAFLAFLLPLVLLFLRKIGILKRISLPLILSDWNGESFEYSSAALKFFTAVLKILKASSFILVVIALSSPVLRHNEKIYTTRGTAILFVVDVSPSMAAKDIANNSRLEAAKTAIKTLSEENSGASFGLVAMASEAAIIVPPTSDRAFFSEQVSSLKCGTLGDGTALGSGISSAVYHLSSFAAPKKAIVLITDGENNSGSIHPETAAELAAKNGIDFYVLGIGTSGTVQIEYVDPESGTVKSGFYESSFKAEPLEMLALVASKTGSGASGKYFGIEKMETLSQALNQITVRQSVSQEYFLRPVDEKLHKKFLFWALVFVLASLFIKNLILNESFRFWGLKRWILREVFRLFAFLALLLAFFGVSFGKEKIPVQKNGNELCFVFDISYSMLASDCSLGRTRLDEAKNLAAAFLDRFSAAGGSGGAAFDSSVPVSVVLLKGDGVQAIPLTEDYNTIYSLLENLSPELMTSPGTSIAKGIDAALKSFPQNSAKSSNIWVFTDGDETDGGLENALKSALSYGTKVAIIGIGNEKETEILTGDGVTKTKTALKSEKLSEIVKNANKKSIGSNAIFIDTKKSGWAVALLKTITDSASKKSIVAYEEKQVSRHKELIMLALIFYVAALLISELNTSKIRGYKIRRGLSVATIFAVLALSGCSGTIETKTEILKGLWSFYQEKYEDASATFLKTAEKGNLSTLEKQYAIFGLAATYMAMEENTAALDRLEEIEYSESREILYGVNYNSGIIAYKSGDFDAAREFFKKAIIADPSKINARINLELCKKSQAEKNAAQNESAMKRVVQTESDKDIERSVFSMIREQESHQWKKAETSNGEGGLDY